MAKIKLYWWYLRYAMLAIWYMRTSPRFAWKMATANGDEIFLDGTTPRDALFDELSYWSNDG